MITRALLTAAVALQLAAPALVVAGAPKQPAAPKQAAAPPAGWTAFEARDAGFTAAFPGAPERLAHVTGTSRMVIYEVGTADERSFVAMIVFGDAGAARIVDEMLLPSLREDARVATDRAVKLDGHAARAVRASGSRSELAIRRLAAFDRHFLLAVRAPAGRPFPEKEARAFFDSFRFRADVTVPEDLAPEAEEANEGDDGDDGAWADDGPPAVLPPARPSQGFRPFQARDAGITLAFPGEPTRAKDGVSIEYKLEGEPGACTFSVMTFLEDEEITAAALDEFVTHLAEEAGSGMTRNEKVAIAGLEGRAVSLALADERIEMRVLRGGSRLYVLLVGGTRATPGQADLDAFFGSFRLLE